GYLETMTMKLHDVLAGLREVAPEALAEPWDKVGLHLGDPEQAVSRGLLCIDLTEAVVAEAVKKKCELVVAYHPPIFEPIKRLTDDGPWTQRRILAAARANLAVYSPHTALDAAKHGVCDWMCMLISDSNGEGRPIVVKTPPRDEFKVVVFVPEDHEVAVREAMSKFGAGGIGNYRECSFSTAGTGGFRPMVGANPVIGKAGRREEVAERRLEMLVPGDKLADVLLELRGTHPYEEPAYDVFKLEPEPAVAADQVGTGRVLELIQAISPDALAASFAQLPETVIKLGHRGVKRIKRVAVCPGAGGSLFEGVEADAYVTGEMQHHQVLDLVQRGKVVVLLGHTASERPYLPIYRGLIQKTAAKGVKWSVSRADRAPLTLHDA
ncbi:MAG: Nif3-like dinuclear metal center hexameric protein, partial [Planctomycetota bacterium]